MSTIASIWNLVYFDWLHVPCEVKTSVILWQNNFILSQIPSVLVKLVCAEKDVFYFEMKS